LLALVKLYGLDRALSETTECLRRAVAGPLASPAAAPTPLRGWSGDPMTAITQATAAATLHAADLDKVHLGPGLLSDRFELNLAYVRSLQPANLLRPYRFEAGLWSWCGTAGTTVGATVADGPDTWHWGWEAPSSQLRGHILGHWLSAAAHVRHGHPEVGVAADEVVAELARCQAANGGEWIAPFSSVYLDRIAAGRPVWAPQYVLHKLFAGLLDAAVIGGNDQARQVLTRAADWFHRWTDQFSRAELNDILDYETGGMIEVWAGLYQLTGEPAHHELMLRYRRGRFFDRLLAGEDVLTNKHANTQIAEILGCAKAYEATGDPQWRQIVEAFWELAVTRRGTYITGGGSSGEIWQPPGQQAARLHDVQEHCTVYNMMRLADYLYRWTGQTHYADYWERNLINGILAQQHPHTGMVTYFLPLEAGSSKTWGHPTQNFWCCHGTLLQAHTSYLTAGVHRNGDAIRVSHYLPGTTTLVADSIGAFAGTITIEPDVRAGIVPGHQHSVEGYEGIQHLHVPPAPLRRPDATITRIRVQATTPATAEVQLRIPHWIAADPTVLVNGETAAVTRDGGIAKLTRNWSEDTIEIRFPTQVAAHPLPDQPDCVAFTDGPVALAGLVDEERALHGDPTHPQALLRPDRERQHSWWNANTFRTVGQERGIRFVPLYQITDERYSVYFPIRH
jgi:DUF1680 family protein